MRQVLLDLLTSKKFLAALTAIVVYLAGHFGLHADPVVLDHIWQALLVYVGAQGIADVGKSAAQINAVTAFSGAGTPRESPSGPATAAKGSTGSLVTVAVFLLGAGIVASATIAACTRGAADPRGATAEVRAAR